MKKMTGKDLISKQAIDKNVAYLEKKGNLTEREQAKLNILKDAQLFKNVEYFVYLKEKGGRERISPIVTEHAQEIVERFKRTKPDEKVWKFVPTKADIHSYRAEYCNQIYRDYAREIKDIPYDTKHAGTGKYYQSQVYHCRLDEKGKKLDKQAMYLCSKALGHNRLEIVANNYIRGL